MGDFQGPTVNLQRVTTVIHSLLYNILFSIHYYPLLVSINHHFPVNLMGFCIKKGVWKLRKTQVTIISLVSTGPLFSTPDVVGKWRETYPVPSGIILATNMVNIWIIHG